jgi:anti-sigma factor RsiW
MLSCKEIVERVDALLDGDLTLRQRLAVRMHLMLCHRCRRYERQLRFLLRGLSKIHSAASYEEVERVMRSIEQGPDDEAAKSPG